MGVSCGAWPARIHAIEARCKAILVGRVVDMGRARRAGRVGAFVVVLLVARAGRAEDGGAEATPAFWLAKAESLVGRVEHPDGRAALLVSVGTGWVEAGELERARPLLASAVKYARQCRGCIAKARRLAEIGLLQHRAGDELGSGEAFSIAREACDELGSDAPRVQAIAYLALQRQQAGEAMLARQLFNDATVEALRFQGLQAVEAHAAVADAEAAAGNLEEAKHASGRMQKAALGQGEEARRIVDASLLERLLAEIEGGDPWDAGKLLVMIDDPRLRVSARCALARVRDAPTFLEPAYDLVAAMAGGRDRAEAALEVARTAADLGETGTAAKARALGGEAGWGRPDVATLVLWADLTREAGEVEAARGALEGMVRLVPLQSEDPTRRAELLGLVAAGLVRAGRGTEAERLLGGVTDAVGDVRARLALAAAFHQAGDEEGALALCAAQLEAMRMWGDDRAAVRAECRRQVAVLQAACGALDQALATVDSIEKPFHAATACTYIARDLR